MEKHTPTVVLGITGVLNLQHPLPRGVLIPRVRRHEGPVIEAIGREVVRPEQQRQDVGVNISQTHPCQPRPGPSLGHPQPSTHLAARRVERVPMGLTRWMARSPRRL